MRKIIMAMSIIFFCLSWAGVKVEKVLETTSIKEYNQWVQKNKAKYPELKPMHISVEQIHKSDSENDLDEYRIQYYNDDGDLNKQEIIKGWFEIYIFNDGANLLIEQRENRYFPINEVRIVKDKNGDTLLNLSSLHSYTVKFWGKSFWLENNSYESGPPDNPTIRIFSQNGDVIGQINNAWHVSEMLTDAREEHLFLTVDDEDGASEVVLLYDIKNGELWRQKFNSATNIAISTDGSYMAVGDSGKIYIFDKKGEIIYTSQAFTNTQRNPSIVFSSDNQYLATILGNSVCLYNNTTGDLLWKKQVDDPESGEKFIHFLQSKNSYYVLVGYTSNNMYIFNKDGEIVKRFQFPFGYTWHYKKTVTGQVVRDRQVAISNWVGKFYNGLLIIKKDASIIIYYIRTD